MRIVVLRCDQLAISNDAVGVRLADLDVDAADITGRRAAIRDKRQPDNRDGIGLVAAEEACLAAQVQCNESGRRRDGRHLRQALGFRFEERVV